MKMDPERGVSLVAILDPPLCSIGFLRQSFLVSWIFGCPGLCEIKIHQAEVILLKDINTHTRYIIIVSLHLALFEHIIQFQT